jgi:hypothetical protein
LLEQLIFEFGVVEDLKPGVQECGSMEEAVDRADEDEQAKSLAEHLVRQWELVQPKDDIPKVLKCGAAAQAIPMSISALILLYDFGGFPLNYLLLEFISIYCVSYAQWYSVFVCSVAFGSSLLLNAS